MKSHGPIFSRSKIGPFSLACTDPYIGIGWEYQSSLVWSRTRTLAWSLSFDFFICSVTFWDEKNKNICHSIIWCHSTPIFHSKIRLTLLIIDHNCQTYHSQKLSFSLHPSQSVGASGRSPGETTSEFEPPHDKTNKMTVPPAWQISLCIRPVWSAKLSRRLWSDWVIWPLLGSQSFCWFCHEAAHLTREKSVNLQLW